MKDNPTDLENKPQDINQPVTEEQKEWIQATSQQSWEPELLISGVAIYLTVSLPGYFEWLYDYYVYNFILDTESVEAGTILLVYEMMSSVSYLLIITFIVHFAMRAFWVGMVGLFSVFPEGIRYEKITFYGNHYKMKLQEKLGRLDAFIVSLDKMCSILFSISFMFVIFLLGVSWMYLLIFMLISILKFFIPDALYKEYEYTIYGSIIALIMLYALMVSILNLKRFHEHPKFKKWYFAATWNFGRVTFPLIYYPMSYILTTLFSNVNTRKITLYGVAFFLAFYVILFFSVLFKRAAHVVESRNFFSQRTESDLVSDQNYDNLRPSDEMVTSISIQADIIKEPYLKVFLAYPKRRDQQLRSFCKTIDTPDSLNKYQKRAILDRHHLECIAKFFKVYIDDSLYQNQDFVYFQSKQPAKKGFLTYIPTQKLSPGKHLLKVTTAVSDTTNEKEYLYTLPFWYMP